jgi:hypothetical protein
MRQAEFVAVIRFDVGANRLAVVERHIGARGMKLECVGMLDREGMNARRLAEEAADQIDVMDAVIEDLDARRLLQKCPEMPRHVNRHADFHVVQLADRAGVDQLSRGQDVRRVAKLKIHRGGQLLPFALLDDPLRLT